MGASEFTQIERGDTAAKAFRAAVDQAKYDHGHSGYSGTIAEKHEFVVIKAPEVAALPQPKGPDDEALLPRRDAAIKAAEALMEAEDQRIRDKWGPAGCIDIGDGEFLFFGRASS